jgi:hypothetical protein
MSRSIKQLVAIWAIAFVTGIITVVYISASLSALSVVQNRQYIGEAENFNPQLTIDDDDLQAAGRVDGNFTTTHNPQLTAPSSVLHNKTTKLQ